jgi:hypothetical protein
MATKYGINFNTSEHSPQEVDLLLEMEAIRRGGIWYVKDQKFGLGLGKHYKNACNLIWPHIDWHRWMELCNKEIRRPNSKVTVIIGAGSTGKTNVSGWEYLLEYYTNPHETLVLITSTDMRGLELRVWGEIKMLHERALERFPFLPGYLIDSKHCITTDHLDDEALDDTIRTRDLRKGVIGIPTVQGSKNVGLGKWQGIKQKHLRLIADDVTAMSQTFLSAFANLNNNVDFQAVVLGNPDDTLDPLGIAAEPKDGWTNHLEPEKTAVWDTKFYGGRCINLVGTDSPNFDFPPDLPPRYPYLVSHRKVAQTKTAFAEDSLEFYSQCKGVMKVSGLAKRVITRDLCREFFAQDDCIWDGDTPLIKIAALDASYGGDRMPLGYIEFGKCVDGKTRIKIHAPKLVSLRVKTSVPMDAETQIAYQVKEFCEANSIPPENFFHDSTGRGSLGTALARVWSAACNPVEFGGVPTSRPVSNDIFIYDKENVNVKRLQRCDEFYANFVTELWYSIRFAIEADQMRRLPEDVMNELCMRQFEITKNDKKKVEPKDKFKERYGFSPDLADWLAIGVEGARRKGFIISKLSAPEPKKDYKWLADMAREQKSLLASRQLAA